MFRCNCKTIPQGLKPGQFFVPECGTAEAMPFQN